MTDSRKTLVVPRPLNFDGPVVDEQAMRRRTCEAIGSAPLEPTWVEQCLAVLLLPLEAVIQLVQVVFVISTNILSCLCCMVVWEHEPQLFLLRVDPFGVRCMYEMRLRHREYAYQKCAEDMRRRLP